LPATEPVQVSVEPPEPPMMLVELRAQDRIVELVITANDTIPVNPLPDATVIAEVPTTPTLTVTPVGVADIVKS
jgi:hypothetical protein